MLACLEDEDSDWAEMLVHFLLGFSDLSWVFLTEILLGDPSHFCVTAAAPDLPDIVGRHPIDSGLAGRIYLQPTGPVIKPNLKMDPTIPPVFNKDDSLRKATSFYGWPLIYTDKLWGSLLFVGSQGETLPNIKISLLRSLVMRLSAHLHQWRLFNRVIELNYLDPQTSLPHRTYFINRLERLIELCQAKAYPGPTLSLLTISGLGRLAVNLGQKKTTEVLKSMAEYLLRSSGIEWELGHVSYGLFALAASGDEREKMDNTLLLFQNSLTELTYSLPGHSNFIFHHARADYPSDGNQAEELLETALARLAESD
jgi:GGDEF domain-containing protein